MTRIAFDIETNGFLEDASVVYCICCQDLDTGEKRGFGPFEIDAGIDHLLTATELVGHNILAYDIPVLTRLHPRFDTGDITITDTLVLSRLIHADLYNADRQGRLLKSSPQAIRKPQPEGLPSGVLKGDYADNADWSEWTQEMQDYCQQDVVVTARLWQHLDPQMVEAIDQAGAASEVCHPLVRPAGRSMKKKP